MKKIKSTLNGWQPALVVVLAVALAGTGVGATYSATKVNSNEYGLGDPPIQGDRIVYLDNNPEFLRNRPSAHVRSPHHNWTLADAGRKIAVPAKVPGDLLTDLTNAGILEEPYFENNFKYTSFCSQAWEYRVRFDIPPSNTNVGRASAREDEDDEVLLVLDGIKMGAAILVNGVTVGNTTDQFLRYTFPLYRSGALDRYKKNDDNTLTIRFDPSIETKGRYMACTGGWDWAPFSDCPKTSDTQSNTFTSGIYKSVYLVRVSSAAILAVVPQTFYRGRYPTKALVDGDHSGFEVHVRVHLWSSNSSRGHVQIKSSWSNITSSKFIEWNGGETNVTISLEADAKDIMLWWPTGVGPNPFELARRHLFEIQVSFIPDDDKKNRFAVNDARSIGFRHFALVTGNDTDPAYVKESMGKEGTQFHGMYFRVNGVPIWSRGANMIPMDELEGRWNASSHVQVVRSAVLGKMNTLRVWGGGVFLPSAWYKACDEYGILVIHDQMYAQGGHSPTVTTTQELELRHNVRLLASHPSISIWDGCNECHVIMDQPTSIYATFVMRIVSEEDASRSVWPSCPASGWKSGVDRLTSRPTGAALITPNRNETIRTIEVHGPYVHGGGFPAVNGNDDMTPIVDPKLPIMSNPTDREKMGVSHPSVFASEFGCGGAMSSFESLSSTLDPAHWSLHGGQPPDNCTQGFNKECSGGNVMAQRNYPCDNIIVAYFPIEEGYFDHVGKQSFQRQIYHCMVGQALQVKSTIEERRSKNELGHLVWQLNEIWPTGGWGSLEYANPEMKGQVLGGRWKPLHYFYRASVFADVMATCNGMGIGYIRNDAGGRAFSGDVMLEVVNIETGTSDKYVHKDIYLPPGPGSLKTFACPIIDGSSHFMMIDVLNFGRSLESRNRLLFAPPKEIKQIWCDSGLNFTIGEPTAGEQVSVPITITTKVPVALFVVLTTETQGHFSDNAFPVIRGSAIVDFHPFGELNLSSLRNTLRVEDMAMYHHPQCKTKAAADEGAKLLTTADH